MGSSGTPVRALGSRDLAMWLQVILPRVFCSRIIGVLQPAEVL